jgi:hypothetical protein
MKTTRIVIVTALTVAMLVPIPGTFAQDQKTLASTMKVYVFPTEGQDASQQSIDEAECYTWAVKNTGNDPFELSKQATQATEQAEQTKQEAAEASKGAGAKGAIGGAAAGAVIGEIASDDAGKGAAYGAAAGAIASRRRAKRKQNQETQQAEQQAARKEEATAEQLEDFKKAFSVCLEAKDYLVKY